MFVPVMNSELDEFGGTGDVVVVDPAEFVIFSILSGFLLCAAAYCAASL